MSDFDPQNPPLGWTHPDERSQEHNDAHEAAVAAMPAFAVQGDAPVGPVKVMLTDFWSHPDVVAIFGQAFTGFGQYTGSCVGVSCGDVICTVSCISTVLDDAPIRAMIPWWPFDYGRSRQKAGMRGQGSGSSDAVIAQVIKEDGVFDAGQAGLPQFTKTGPDGWWLTKALELQWSQGSAIDRKWFDLAKQWPVGTVSPVESSQDVKLSILSMAPVLYGCSMFVSRGSIKGDGANAYVTGKYDKKGGHSTAFMGYWDHPNDGPLYGYSNQWPTTTYPKDPAGLGRCCVWVPESEVDKVFSRYGGRNGESVSVSHLNYLKLQAKPLDWRP